MLAFYVVAAERQGVPPDRLGGTIQNDILKEYIAQKEWFFPPDPAMRLVDRHDRVLLAAHAALEPGHHQRLPHPRGRLDRRAGARVHARRRARPTSSTRSSAGLDVDDFAPRLSFFFNAHNDFFEEIAKFRAARRIWARELRETFGAEGAEVVADALPRADRGRVADRAAAAQQHRPRRDPGARRRARRHAVAAHQLLDETLALPTEEAVHDRAAHAADHRRRDRRRRTRSTRSAAATSSRS